MQTSETNPKVLNKANKLRMTGAELVILDNVILSKSNKTDQFGITDITLYIELDNQHVQLGAIPGLKSWMPQLSRLTVKGNGRPKSLILGHNTKVSDNITEIVIDIDTSNITNMCQMFDRMRSVNKITFKRFDTSNVEEMDGMFEDCSNLANLDVNTFNTSKVTSMNRMFKRCGRLNYLDLSTFNVNNLKSMDEMFEGCINLAQLNISTWDTPNLLKLNSAFAECSTLKTIDLSSFNMTRVTEINTLFQFCLDLRDIKFPEPQRFQLNNARSLYGMFMSCRSLKHIDLRGLEGREVNSIHAMFEGCISLSIISMGDFNPRAILVLDKAFSDIVELRYLDLRSLELYYVLNYNNAVLSTWQPITLILKSTDQISNGIKIDSGDYIGYTDMTEYFKQLKSMGLGQSRAISNNKRLEPDYILQLILTKHMEATSIQILYPT